MKQNVLLLGFYLVLASISESYYSIDGSSLQQLGKRLLCFFPFVFLRTNLSSFEMHFLVSESNSFPSLLFWLNFLLYAESESFLLH